MWAVNNFQFTSSFVCLSGKMPSVCGGKCRILAVMIIENEHAMRQGVDSGEINAEVFCIIGERLSHCEDTT